MVYILHVPTWSLFADPVTYVYNLHYKNLVVESIIRVQSSPGFSEGRLGIASTDYITASVMTSKIVSGLQ